LKNYEFALSFQADDEGSIPFTRSILPVNDFDMAAFSAIRGGTAFFGAWDSVAGPVNAGADYRSRKGDVRIVIGSDPFDQARSFFGAGRCGGEMLFTRHGFR
jgi:hypothetical protein